MNQKPLKKIFPFRCQGCGRTSKPYHLEDSEYASEISKSRTQKSMELSRKAVALSEECTSLFEKADFHVKKFRKLIQDYKDLTTQLEDLAKTPLINGFPTSHDYPDFYDIARLWGFIALRERGFLYFGFTCPNPDCKRKTTINKYDWEEVEFEFHNIIRDITGNRFSGGLGDSSRKDLFIIPFCVPFLIQHDIIRPPDGLIEIKDLDEKFAHVISHYELPEGNHISDYGDYFAEYPYSPLPCPSQYFISSKNIESLLKIENEEGYKVFPRLVFESSIYLLLEHLRRDLYDTDGTTVGYRRGVEDVMIKIVAKNRQEKKSPSYIKKYYAKDDIPLEEYLSFNLEERIDEDLLVEHAPQLRKDYIRVRNRIDFELIYKNDLIKKYAVTFFKKGKKPKRDPKYDDHREFVFEEMDRLKKMPENKNMTNKELAERLVKYVKKRGKSRESSPLKPFGVPTYMRWISERYPKKSKRGGRPRGSKSKK